MQEYPRSKKSASISSRRHRAIERKEQKRKNQKWHKEAERMQNVKELERLLFSQS